VTGAGLLVSASDRDFTDSFKEASALAHYLGGHRESGETELIRELAAVKGTGFGFSGAQKVAEGTLEALRTTMTVLEAKAPDEVEPYRRFVLGVATAVAEAKSGVSDVETAAIAAITEALGGGES
jgi:hypothetical protein